MAQPTVSLVIPILNGEAFLDESLAAVEAFFDRSGLDAEIIAVDDGSTAARLSSRNASPLKIGMTREIVG